MINARPKSRSTRITVKRHERHNASPSHIRRSAMALPDSLLDPPPLIGGGGVPARRNVAKKWRKDRRTRGRGTDPCPDFEHARSDGNARSRLYVFRISCSLAKGLAALLARGRSGERGNASRLDGYDWAWVLDKGDREEPTWRATGWIDVRDDSPDDASSDESDESDVRRRVGRNRAARTVRLVDRFLWVNNTALFVYDSATAREIHDRTMHLRDFHRESRFRISRSATGGCKLKKKYHVVRCR